jgi:hypothetical protein
VRRQVEQLRNTSKERAKKATDLEDDFVRVRDTVVVWLCGHAAKRCTPPEGRVTDYTRPQIRQATGVTTLEEMIEKYQEQVRLCPMISACFVLIPVFVLARTLVPGHSSRGNVCESVKRHLTAPHACVTQTANREALELEKADVEARLARAKVRLLRGSH